MKTEQNNSKKKKKPQRNQIENKNCTHMDINKDICIYLNFEKPIMDINKDIYISLNFEKPIPLILNCTFKFKNTFHK